MMTTTAMPPSEYQRYLDSILRICKRNRRETAKTLLKKEFRPFKAKTFDGKECEVLDVTVSKQGNPHFLVEYQCSKAWGGYGMSVRSKIWTEQKWVYCIDIFSLEQTHLIQRSV